jgi:ABC-2 type transport system ATP-binding protein
MGQAEEILPALQQVKGIVAVTRLDQKEPNTCDLNLETDGVTDVRADIFRTLARMDRPLLSLRSSEMSLEDIFLELTRESEV